MRLSQESRIEWRNNYLLLNLIFLPYPTTFNYLKPSFLLWNTVCKKKLSMLIRANELKHTLSFYNSPYSCNTFKTCSNSSGINANTSLNDILNNEAIMKTIMAYCPDNIEQLINTYRNFSKMSDMLGMMDMFNNASGDNSFNNVNSSGFNNASSNEFNNNNSNDNSEFSNFNNNTGSGGFNNININNILNSSQKDMYNEYIKQLDKLDFNDSNNYGSSNNN